MINPKIKNKIKPVNCDIHLEYRCPDCGISHWLNLRECQTSGFKVVCVCNCVFGVKRIDDIRIKYARKKSDTKPIEKDNPKKDRPDKDDLYHKCMTTLSQYSFSEEEIGDILKNTIDLDESSTVIDIVKTCITKFGEKNNA